MIDEIKKTSEDRLKRIAEIKKEIDKKYGKEALVDFSSTEIRKVPSISSGSLLLDTALGVGGWPQGRFVEVFGGESVGKSTLAMEAVVSAQRMGKLAAYFDFESAYDPFYGEKLGIDHESLFFSQPDSAESGMQMVEDLVRSGEFSLVVVDSVAALVPMAELEGEIGQRHMALQAALMGQVCRKLAPVCKKNGTILFFINQIRSSMNPYGPSNVTPGGKALPFYASVRVELKKKEKVVKGSDDPTGNMFLAKVIKNKVAPPFREALYEIEFGKGISKKSEIIDMAVKFDIIKKGGAWFSYGEEKFQGKEATKAWLDENPETSDLIEKEIKARLYGN